MKAAVLYSLFSRSVIKASEAHIAVVSTDGRTDTVDLVTDVILLTASRSCESSLPEIVRGVEIMALEADMDRGMALKAVMAL